MAYVESSVVVYLRELYYPEGFLVEGAEAISALSPRLLRLEVGRELATLSMLAAVSLLAARKGWWERFAFFMWSFAAWDIFYYVWLYIVLRWPADLMALDVLFLVPRPWVAPVVLPVTVSGIMMASAAAILRRTR